MVVCIVAMASYLRLGISFLAEAGENNVKQVRRDEPVKDEPAELCELDEASRPPAE
jgi:hypothetical protein